VFRDSGVVYVIGSRATSENEKDFPESACTPDDPALQEWAIREKVHWTAPLYMVHNTQVLREFDKHIAHINSALPVQEQIHRFRLLHEPWTIEQGLVTPSFKLRRDVIETHYHKVIDEMYA
jgi:long-chain acyl-CoA synthetase